MCIDFRYVKNTTKISTKVSQKKHEEKPAVMTIVKKNMNWVIVVLFFRFFILGCCFFLTNYIETLGITIRRSTYVVPSNT